MLAFSMWANQLYKPYLVYQCVFFFFLGSFQPSNDMMLKFYSYYKQATIGACNIPRPGFWDAVGRAKW